VDSLSISISSNQLVIAIRGTVFSGRKQLCFSRTTFGYKAQTFHLLLPPKTSIAVVAAHFSGRGSVVVSPAAKQIKLFFNTLFTRGTRHATLCHARKGFRATSASRKSTD
jgi:hypothetical protein